MHDYISLTGVGVLGLDTNAKSVTIDAAYAASGKDDINYKMDFVNVGTLLSKDEFTKHYTVKAASLGERKNVISSNFVSEPSSFSLKLKEPTIVLSSFVNRALNGNHNQTSSPEKPLNVSKFEIPNPPPLNQIDSEMKKPLNNEHSSNVQPFNQTEIKESFEKDKSFDNGHSEASHSKAQPLDQIEIDELLNNKPSLIEDIDTLLDRFESTLNEVEEKSSIDMDTIQDALNLIDSMNSANLSARNRIQNLIQKAQQPLIEINN